MTDVAQAHMPVGSPRHPLLCRPPLWRLALLGFLAVGLVGLAPTAREAVRWAHTEAEPALPSALGARRAWVDKVAEARTTADVERAGVLLREVWAEEPDPARRARLAEELVIVETSDWPSDYRGHFLRTVAASALGQARANRVPVSVVLAQAVLESGWGRSVLARDYNNLFGIKAGRGPGVVLGTVDWRDGERVGHQGGFRTFATPNDSVAFHAALLGRDRRYAGARSSWTDWRTYLGRISRIYATDPGYVGRVSGLVHAYGLDRWDVLVAEAAWYDGCVAAWSRGEQPELCAPGLVDATGGDGSVPGQPLLPNGRRPRVLLD